MSELTRNLFYGTDETSFELDVEGSWPTDVSGHLFNIGPGRSEPGNHWFSGQGLLMRLQCAPTAEGRVRVDFGKIETPLSKIRDAQPGLFRTNGAAEVSPFGFTNFANTNVQWMNDRLFLGYDVGRPYEVDPVTLEALTPIGSNAEWLHSVPGPVEPMTAVAAHPGPAWDEGALYFANYEMIPLSEKREFRLCRWDLEGAVEHWLLEDMAHFDSVHDVKVCRDYVVISDLPFIGGPDLGPEAPRRPVADHANIWIISKRDVESNAPGSSLPYRHLTVPMMGGHMAIDYDNAGSEIVLYLTHHPMTDLAMGIHADDRVHGTGERFDTGYVGLIPAATQPIGIGRYRIDGESGKLLDHNVAARPDIFWGGLLFTQNLARPESRDRVENLWFTSLGYEPDLITERWWQIYAETFDNVFVPPRDLPADPIPGNIVRFDTAAMDIVDRWDYPLGSFPHPATFIPRDGASSDLDGYVVVMVHRDGAKAMDVFDAADLASGPIASASAPGFNVPMLLHSTWAPEREGARPSSYAIDPEADAWWTLNAFAENPAAALGIAKAMYDLAPLPKETD